jgi:hypothetical protein
VAATGVEAFCLVSVKVVVVSVLALIVSEKVASTFVPREAFCNRSAGDTLLIVGAVVSTVQGRVAAVGSVLSPEALVVIT